MAPRSTKVKKAANAKVVETVTKKTNSKSKIVAEPDLGNGDVEENVLDISTKPKINAVETSNNGDGAPAPKRGRKKIEKIQVESKETEDIDQQPEQADKRNKKLNGNSVPEITEAVTDGKGKKKTPRVAKGKKQIEQENVEEEDQVDEELIEEKPKTKGKGRKPAAKQAVETTKDQEKVEEKSATKGRKRGAVKPVENIPSPEYEEVENEPEIKDTKAKRTQVKKGKSAESPVTTSETAAKKQKTAKKEKKVKDVEEETIEDVEMEAKPAKGKRGAKKPLEKLQDPEPEDQEPTSKRRRKATAENVEEEPKKKAPLKNKSVTDYSSIDFSHSTKTPQGKEWNFKIASWNVDGIRAWCTKGGLDYIKHEKPDILCLQEVKCTQDKLPADAANIPGYHAYWLCSEKDGYAGVGIYTTKLAMNVSYGLQNEELDSEGRIITAEYEEFYLICTYVPNAGRKLVTLPKRLKWNEQFRKHVKELDEKKPVIICGDMNVAHNEIDLANPKTNKKNAGFTEEERAGMTELLSDGFVDTFRHFYPDRKDAYSFWTYMSNSRAKNVGWRLDYFIVSERLVPSICDNVIRDGVYGSDHCPLTLFLHLTTADKPKE